MYYIIAWASIAVLSPTTNKKCVSWQQDHPSQTFNAVNVLNSLKLNIWWYVKKSERTFNNKHVLYLILAEVPGVARDQM